MGDLSSLQSFPWSFPCHLSMWPVGSGNALRLDPISCREDLAACLRDVLGSQLTQIGKGGTVFASQWLYLERFFFLRKINLSGWFSDFLIFSPWNCHKIWCAPRYRQPIKPDVFGRMRLRSHMKLPRWSVPCVGVSEHRWMHLFWLEKNVKIDDLHHGMKV